MTNLPILSGFQSLVNLGTPMDDILAIGIFALPLAALGIILLIYQRHLPQDELKRNLMVLSGIICLAASFLAVLYAASPILPWSFGSWDTFARGLQVLADVFFGSVEMALLYITGCLVFFSVLAHFIIAAPEPDFVGLRTELKTVKEEAKQSKDTIRQLEVDNKRLNEFLAEKETSLTTLEGELETIKAEIGERESSISLMEEQLRTKSKPSGVEESLRTQVQQRDITIESLQSEMADLRLMLESVKPSSVSPRDDGKLSKLEKDLQNTQARWVDLTRRAETASQVSDSIVSDLVELISQVQSSKREDSTKQTLISLIEGIGRSMTRVAREAGDVQSNEPKVELIGAIIMTNEIVDAIKKQIRL